MAMKRRAMKKTKVEIIPMIDTMFFLLVFFILSSVGVIKMQGIDINLPKPAPPDVIKQVLDPKPDEIVISISPKGAVMVGMVPAPPSGDIRKLIQDATQASIRNKKLKLTLEEALKETTVVISADPAAEYGIMVNCMDQSRALGIKQFAIAALAADQTPSGK